MLSVQRPVPVMASRKTSDLDQPFGYAFDLSNDPENGFPFPPAPEPAPGPSILDAAESRFLDNFFDGVSSETYNSEFFAVDNVQLNFGWTADLPPTFMGTTSSYGQQPNQTPTTTLADMSLMDLHSPLTMNPDVLPTTSPDVLAAAPLLQSLHDGHNNLGNHSPHAPLTSRSTSLQDNALFGVSNSLSHGLSRPSPTRMHTAGPSGQFAQRPRPQSRATAPTLDTLRDSYYTEMMFGTQAANAMILAEKPPNPTLDWGSDAGFTSGPNFIAPANQESLESVEGRLQNRLQFLEPPSSATTTAPPTPKPMKTPEIALMIPADHSQENGESPSKRAKTGAAEDEDEDGTPVSGQPPRKRRGTKQSPTIPAGSPPQSKRRKSRNSSNSKAPRENLTEEQKRENHIKSEQKRRTLIKTGFEDLALIMPETKTGGFSKSVVLTMVAEWIEDMERGNEKLRAQLNALKAAKGIPENS